MNRLRTRAALFIDGFNLYHAVADLKADYLKWADLWRLGADIIPSGSQDLVSVDFCTAFFPGDFHKRIRHDRFNKALSLRGVTIHLGHYIHEPKSCPSCHESWMRPTEKQTDINVALSLFDAARRDTFDHGYLLSADSDQVATVEWFGKAFPEKDLTIVVPPERPGSKQIKDRGGRPIIRLNRDHFERCHFGPSVTDGTDTVLRPFEYDPPAGWVHPDERKADKPPKPPKRWKSTAKSSLS